MEDRPAREQTQRWALSLVIPAYNEAAGIATAIAEADTALAALAAEYEILVVDDGSSDATAQQVIEAARDRACVRLLQHPRNRGYGAALRTGFENAQHELVAFTDADCQFDLADLGKLVPLTGQHPLVVGYRERRQDPWRRRFLSWGYNVLARALLGTRVRDCDCALKVFRRETVRTLMPKTRGFFVNTEMLTRARQQGYAIAEVGVRHRPRLRGHSKVSLGDVPRTLRALVPFWWNEVMFRGASRCPGSSLPGSARERGVTASLASSIPGLFLMLVAALLFFGRLGCPLQEPQEPRYAEIPRQMLAEGSLAVPVYHGLAYLDKPPLLYWLVMASYSLWGVHDWAARLVPALAGFLCVLSAYEWARRTVGARSALLGALILCLSVRFVQLGRMLTMDGLLCLWVVVGWATAHVALQRGRLRWGWWLSAALACGLGLLTKGPVALVLVVVPVLAFQLLDRRAARPRFGQWTVFVGSAVGVAAPWYAWMLATSAEFGEHFFVRHHVDRFLEPFDHAEPAWFYLPDLLGGMFPWTLLLPGLALYLGRRSGELAERRPAGLGFFLLACGWALAFFSLAGCKRSSYILPAMPPLALALGCYLDALLPRAAPRRRDVRWLWHRSALAYRASLLTLIAAAAVVLSAGWRGLLSTESSVILVCVAGGLLGWLAALARSRQAAVSWGMCGTATLAMLLVGLQVMLPAYARQYSLRGVVRRHAEGYGKELPVISYPRRWDSVSFYLGRQDVQVYTADQREQMFADLHQWPETLVFVKAERWLADFLGALPGDLEFVPQGRQGYVHVGIVRRRSEEWSQRRD